MLSDEYDDVDERCLHDRVFKCCHYDDVNVNVPNDYDYNRYVTVVGTKGRFNAYVMVERTPKNVLKTLLVCDRESRDRKEMVDHTRL